MVSLIGFEEEEEEIGIGVGMRMGSGRKLLYSFGAPFWESLDLEVFVDGPDTVLGILMAKLVGNKWRYIYIYMQDGMYTYFFGIRADMMVTTFVIT